MWWSSCHSSSFTIYMILLVDWFFRSTILNFLCVLAGHCRYWMLLLMQKALNAGELYSSSTDSIIGLLCRQIHMDSISLRIVTTDLFVSIAVSKYPVTVSVMWILVPCSSLICTTKSPSTLPDWTHRSRGSMILSWFMAVVQIVHIYHLLLMFLLLFAWAVHRGLSRPYRYTFFLLPLHECICVWVLEASS